MIFRFREKSALKIEFLETKNSIYLPPIYKIFIETFCLGEKEIFIEKYKLKNSNILFPLMSYNYFFNDENIGFSHFIEIEKAFDVFLSGGLNDLIYEKKYFPIASSDGNGLYVGTTGLEVDKILWDGADGNLPKIIANNVFEFIRDIKIENVKEEFLYGNTKYSKLYKNFGEDFWRVREENI